MTLTEESDTAGVTPRADHSGEVGYTAPDLLNLPGCRSATSVERMAHRWCLEPPCEAEQRPALLLAPRFARVPWLRIANPCPETPCDVRVTGWTPEGWFSHLRVKYPGAAFPVTVRDPVQTCRPGGEEALRKSTRPRLWEATVFTLPAGTPHIEIGKTEAAEACLAAVAFRPCAAQPAPPHRGATHAEPMVCGIVDSGILAGEILQAYDRSAVAEFYAQMAAMGFTHLFPQVYAGRASWSRIARAYRKSEYGHMAYANWLEPARETDTFFGNDNASPVQRDLDEIRAAGLRMFASFRINNEWMADWARKMLRAGDNGIPDQASVFSVEHPEFWMTHKNGNRSGGGLDFAFSEVREYRLSILREWCDLFHGFDGICIDLWRWPPMVSYPEHLVQAFKERSGIDVRAVEPVDEHTRLPGWLAFRAAPFTAFMRAVRDELRSRYGTAVQLAARVSNSFEEALFDGADLHAWIDEGLVDLLVLQHRPPANPVERDSRPVIEAAHRAGVKTVHLLGGNLAVEPVATDLDPVPSRIATWRQWGTDGFGFYEAERVAIDGRWLRTLPGLVNAWGGGRR